MFLMIPFMDAIAVSFNQDLSENLGMSHLVVPTLNGNSHAAQILEPMGMTDQTTRSTTKVLTENLGMTDQTTLTTTKVLTENLGMTDQTTRSTTKVLTENLGMTDDTARTLPPQLLSESLGITDQLTRTTTKPLSENLGMTDQTTRSTTKVLTENLGVTGSVAVTLPPQLLSESLGITDQLTAKITIKSLSERLGMNDALGTTYTIPSSQTTPTIDYSSSVSGGAVTISNSQTISVSTTNVNTEIIIPSGITISGTSWSGVLNLPTTRALTSVTLPVSGTTTSVIEVGAGDTLLTFDKAIRLKFEGKGGQSVGYSRTGIPFTEITSTCTSLSDESANTAAIGPGGDCKITSGNDLYLWVRHFTSFASFTSSTGGGSGGPGDRTEPSILVGFRDNEFPLEVDGVKYRVYELGSVRTTTVNTGDKFSTILRVYENGGPQNVQHAELYVNHRGSIILNDLKETTVTYDKQSGIGILDPHGLISSANVVVSEAENKAEFKFEIIFAKAIPESDMLFRLWDTGRNDMDLYLPNSLIVLPSQNIGIIQEKPSLPLAEPVPIPKDQPKETPTREDILPEAEPAKEEIEQPNKFTSEQLAVLKKWSGFDVQSADDSEVLATFGIKGTEIPSWFKNPTRWYLEGKLTKDEFVNALVYFKAERLLDDISLPSKTMAEVNPSSNLSELQSNEKITIEQKSENNLYVKADVRQIENKVSIIRALSNNPQIQEILVNSNNEFDKNSQIKQLIDEQDLDWKRNWKNITPFMKEFMNNKGALIAKAVIENEQEDLLPIKSILITNAYGANVIITNLVPDYKQNDEKWWQVAKTEGIYITSGANSDEYSGVFTREIILPITDSKGEFIGVIKAIVNLEKTLTRD